MFPVVAQGQFAPGDADGVVPPRVAAAAGVRVRQATVELDPHPEVLEDDVGAEPQPPDHLAALQPGRRQAVGELDVSPVPQFQRRLDPRLRRRQHLQQQATPADRAPGKDLGAQGGDGDPGADRPGEAPDDVVRSARSGGQVDRRPDRRRREQPQDGGPIAAAGGHAAPQPQSRLRGDPAVGRDDHVDDRGLPGGEPVQVGGGVVPEEGALARVGEGGDGRGPPRARTAVDDEHPGVDPLPAHLVHEARRAGVVEAETEGLGAGDDTLLPAGEREGPAKRVVHAPTVPAGRRRTAAVHRVECRRAEVPARSASRSLRPSAVAGVRWPG